MPPTTHPQSHLLNLWLFIIIFKRWIHKPSIMNDSSLLNFLWTLDKFAYQLLLSKQFFVSVSYKLSLLISENCLKSLPYKEKGDCVWNERMFNISRRATRFFPRVECSTMVGKQVSWVGGDRHWWQRLLNMICVPERMKMFRKKDKNLCSQVRSWDSKGHSMSLPA